MKKTFTILHTNDMHSALIGIGPASDYTPFTLNDDSTRGGYARLGGLIARRKEARKDDGPVLVLDAGDYSMGTAFAAACRETGGELRLMSLMEYDAVTLGNHEFDLGPEGLGRSIGAAAEAMYEVLCQGVATAAGKDAVREIKEWQAIMDHLRSLPIKGQDPLPAIPVDGRAAEVRAIRAG